MGVLEEIVRVELKFVPQDMWVGAFWQHTSKAVWPYVVRELKVYVCLLPMLPIIFTFERSRKPVKA